ncbi:MAG: gliding motility protein GldM [Cyclobacteriaceae bacterium]
MAGGKETGRQKMVGMMYLVLTALLALNVSNTIIDKFVFLNESLVRANDETHARNQQILESIVKKVDDSGNRDADVKVMDAARELREETERVYKELTQVKLSMIEITEGYIDHEPEYEGDAKHLAGKTDYSKVGHYMMPVDEGGEGKGEELKALLNDYAAFTKSTLEGFDGSESEAEHLKPIAVDAADDPVYNKDPNQNGKKFAQLAFEESPTPACLATVSEFQSRVLSYETRAMDFLMKRVGAGDLSFDQIVAMVKPESKYVAAGTKYTAELFIAASASGITPTMTYNGNSIPVDGGVGMVEFTATPGDYDKNGIARKTFEAAITVPLPGGGDTTYASVNEYFVRKPVISVQSQSVNALYFNCGNKLDVQVPALGNSYNPTFSVNGGSHIKGATTGQVTVVPTNPTKVTLNVSSNGNPVGSVEYGVRPIPAVEVLPRTDRGPVNIKAGMSTKTPRLYLEAVPDEGFKSFLPDDAKFRVAEASVTWVSGGIGRGTINGSDRINLGQIASNARKGDQIVVEIKRVQRQNFRGQVEEFPRFNKFIAIPLN